MRCSMSREVLSPLLSQNRIATFLYLEGVLVHTSNVSCFRAIARENNLDYKQRDTICQHQNSGLPSSLVAQRRLSPQHAFKRHPLQSWVRSALEYGFLPQ